MIVYELIEELKKHPSGMRVIVDGYEYGYSDITSAHIGIKTILLNQHSEDWAGSHEVVQGGSFDEIALLISRYEID